MLVVILVPIYLFTRKTYPRFMDEETTKKFQPEEEDDY